MSQDTAQYASRVTAKNSSNGKTRRSRESRRTPNARQTAATRKPLQGVARKSPTKQKPPVSRENSRNKTKEKSKERSKERQLNESVLTQSRHNKSQSSFKDRSAERSNERKRSQSMNQSRSSIMKRTNSQNKARNEMLNKAKAYGNKVSKKNVDGENSMPKITQSHHNSTNLPQSPSQQEDQLNMT